MRILCNNKKVQHEYFILETYEAGIVLNGCEVKSVLKGNASVLDSFCFVREGEVWLKNCYIKPYENGSFANEEERRDRKLLLHRSEINKIIGKLKDVGITLLVKKLYLSKNFVKAELVLAKGKKLHDKSKAKKEQDIKRLSEREIKNFKNKGY